LKLTSSKDINPPDPQRVNDTVQGQSVPLNAEPKLAQNIEQMAETANNPAAADHFAKAATNLQDAYNQDKEWLAKHPNMDQGSRT